MAKKKLKRPAARRAPKKRPVPKAKTKPKKRRRPQPRPRSKALWARVAKHRKRDARPIRWRYDRDGNVTGFYVPLKYQTKTEQKKAAKSMISACSAGAYRQASYPKRSCGYRGLVPSPQAGRGLAYARWGFPKGFLKNPGYRVGGLVVRTFKDEDGDWGYAVSTPDGVIVSVGTGEASEKLAAREGKADAKMQGVVLEAEGRTMRNPKKGYRKVGDTIKDMWGDTYKILAIEPNSVRNAPDYLTRVISSRYTSPGTEVWVPAGNVKGEDMAYHRKQAAVADVRLLKSLKKGHKQLVEEVRTGERWVGAEFGKGLLGKALDKSIAEVEGRVKRARKKNVKARKKNPRVTMRQIMAKATR